MCPPNRHYTQRLVRGDCATQIYLPNKCDNDGEYNRDERGLAARKLIPFISEADSTAIPIEHLIACLSDRILISTEAVGTIRGV